MRMGDQDEEKVYGLISPSRMLAMKGKRGATTFSFKIFKAIIYNDIKRIYRQMYIIDMFFQTSF